MDDINNKLPGDDAGRNQLSDVLENENNLNALVVETMASLLVVLDRTGRVVRFNRACERTTGYAFEEIRGRCFWEFLLRDEDIEAVKKNFERLRTGKFPNDYENYWITKSGEERFISWSNTALVDRTGTVEYIVATGIDITERKLLDKRLRLLESAVKQSNDAVLITTAEIDAPGPKIIFANPAFLNMSGYDLDEILGQSPRIVQGAKTERAVLDEVRRCLETGEDFRGSTVNYRKDGSEYDVEWSIAPIRNRAGAISNYVAVQQDITNQKRDLEALHESERRYRLLFENNPQPMWVFDCETLAFLAVNAAAIRHYGYTHEEFLAMTIEDIRPNEGLEALSLHLAQRRSNFGVYGEWQHLKKDGTIIDVEISAHVMTFAGRDVKLILSQDITERKRAEQSLQKSEEQYRFLADSIPQQIWTARADGALEYTNKCGLDYFQSEPGEFGGWSWQHVIHPEDLPRSVERWHRSVSTGEAYEIEFRLRRAADNAYRWHLGRAVAMRGAGGEVVKWFGTNTDIDDRKQIEVALREKEEYLRQAQKMESVGRLAGGIAHDFNNMLTAISGYSNLTLRQLKPDDPLVVNINEIGKAAERSAALTRQLLAFSRRQVQQLKVLNINQIIEQLQGMLGRLVGEDVELTGNLNPALGRVSADAGQIEQIIMNLVVNSRDAMPEGGKITIETDNVFLDEDFAGNNPGSKSGSYIRLSVADNGIGIDAEMRQKIFEPFFTTKEVGKGTGLGLATVYGIVKQSDGYITVDSEIGRGTVFNIYLPQVNQAAESLESSGRETGASGGAETVLLVEDEEIVRNLTRLILESGGYKVIAAANPNDALDVCRAYAGAIDLLLTDMVLPELSGRRLAEQALPLRPGLKVIYMSGYNEETIANRNARHDDIVFLEKPFTLEIILAKVRETLDATR